MATAADTLAQNLSFANFSKATDLKKRLWFTIGALIVFRLCSFVPLPGIDPQALSQLFTQTAGGMLDFVNMFSGGALERMSIIALGIMPYITASIVVQLMGSIYEPWKALKKEGESGRKKLNQYTRFGTVVLTIFQGYGIAVGLESWGASAGASAVIDPGWFFRISTIITLLGGTMFLMWLGEQITSRGIGNGISLIIMAGIVAQIPMALGGLLEQGRTGAISPGFIMVIIVLALAVVAFICLMERAQRRIPIQYPKRQVGNRMFQGDSSHLPLKLNTANVIPPIFASSLLLLPLTIAQFMGQEGGPEWLLSVTTALQHGAPLYMALYAAGIIFFSFFYTAVVFNPEETADNLKKHGGFVPGIRPGEKTAVYLDYVLTRITVVGAAYLTFVCLMPEFLISRMAVPFYLGGTSLLIVVNVTMDTVAQIQGHLLAHQYEGLIKKAKLRTGGRR
ncbi:preprotein translocase subunit SecY [Sandaracinobacter sp. RS1-74]|uniref:preprotein translocase subunit SecY n=1 Tax=Sandaracinobacteroides sayramensis TaxID=2913411 RepID=UPI001EDA54A1|nr:preprotein translocase subunit SecY [Sandaracinobacteroides sayramensis]MCG2840788.1 preprotein translocase subunit SecY [Sandaracinobacteroides sayramensis]